MSYATDLRSASERGVTTSNKLWLGFGTMAVLLVLSNATIIVLVQSIEVRVGEMANARNLSAAARQLEVNTFGYFLKVQAFLQTGEPLVRQGAVDDAAELELQLKDYERLSTTDRQRAMAARFAPLSQEFQELGQTLLGAENRQANPADLTKFYVLRDGLEKFLDGEMQVEAVGTYNARRDAALQGVRTIVGLALILLIVGVVIALITSRTVGKALLRGERVTAEQSELLRTTLTSIGDGVIATDTEGRITQMNPMAESLSGWTHAEALGHPLDAVFRMVSEETRQTALNPLPRALKEGVGGGLANDTVLITKDGTERFISGSGASIRSKDGESVGGVLIIQDVTDRKRAENELRQLAADLSEADRRKSEFLATLAHELRNPLAPVRNAVEFLRMKGPDIPELHWATEIIDRQTQAMTRLIDDLMDISRINQGKLELQREQVELTIIVQGAVETSRPLIESMGHALTVTLPPGPVIVDADPTRLAQVLLNLLNNAAKYTERGGRIDLRAELQGSDVVVSVTDTGIGIPADKLPTIFEMFSQVEGTLSRSQGGLGIGLSLVKRLVEMHGGSVEAKSGGPAQGSEFDVRLPIVVEQTYPRQVSDDGDKVQPTSDLRILVVDDNRDAAETLAMLIKMMGNNVQKAHDGEEAVAAAREYRPHVVLCDIGLPKLNGYEACRQMKAQAWDAKMILIAVTGWGQDGDRRKSEEAGFDHHLVKPVAAQALMKLLAGLDTPKA